MYCFSLFWSFLVSWLHSICDSISCTVSFSTFSFVFVPDEGLCLSSKICLNKYTLYDKAKVFSISTQQLIIVQFISFYSISFYSVYFISVRFLPADPRLAHHSRSDAPHRLFGHRIEHRGQSKKLRLGFHPYSWILSSSIEITSNRQLASQYTLVHEHTHFRLRRCGGFFLKFFLLRILFHLCSSLF